MGTIAAVLSGAAMALQGAMNAQLSRPLGLYWMLVSVQLLGVLTALGLAFWRTPGLPSLISPPVYLYLAGPLGVAITALVALSVPRLGMVRTTTFIVVAQLLAAVLLDHLGILGLETRPFPLWRLVGVALLAAGAQILLHA
ncbi:MAG: DMT family transporter [Thermaerobacter sp.]|nr:DMT family transporter [Thermaerobacter sp.]